MVAENVAKNLIGNNQASFGEILEERAIYTIENGITKAETLRK